MDFLPPPLIMFNTLEEAREFIADNWVLEPGQYPCLECHANGKTPNPKTIVDPTTHYYVDEITCRSCNGSGLTTEEDFKAWYKQQAKVYRNAKKQHKADCKRLKQLLKELSTDDKRLLRRFFR